MECILVNTLFLTVTVSVSGIEMKKSPFGPLMCDMLCHRTVDCRYFFYVPQNLTCSLGNTSTALDGEALKITISKVVGNTTDISKCSRNYKTFKSRSKKSVCFNQHERRNTISNDAQVSLQPAQPKSTTPTCRSNTAIVQCSDRIGLYQASAAGNLSRVQQIISKELEHINCRGKGKRTPVMAAVRKGHEKVFDFLVSHCCDLHSVDNQNNKVIHLASIVGNDGIVKKLIDKRPFDVNARGSQRKTPLLYAAKYGHVGVFNILISKGSNVKRVDMNKNNILHLACRKGRVEMVKHILSLNLAGVGIESKGYRRRTPIMTAVCCKKRQVIEFLVSKGCNLGAVDVNGDTILHSACKVGNIDIVTYIISLGTGNEKRKNKNGRTPVQVARSSSIAALISLRKRRDVKT